MARLLLPALSQPVLLLSRHRAGDTEQLRAGNRRLEPGLCSLLRAETEHGRREAGGEILTFPAGNSFPSWGVLSPLEDTGRPPGCDPAPWELLPPPFPDRARFPPAPSAPRSLPIPRG